MIEATCPGKLSSCKGGPKDPLKGPLKEPFRSLKGALKGTLRCPKA